MGGTTNFPGGFVNNGTVVDASYFRVVNISKQGSDINLTWTSVGGRGYVVQTNAPPPQGSYTNNFAAIFTVTNTVGTTTNYLDAGGTANVPAFFYRVRLVP